jgi:beta-glucosidase
MKRYLLLFSICSVLSAQQKSIDERVDSVLALMTPLEKIGQLNQYSGGWDTGTKTTGSEINKKEFLREGKIGSLLNVIGTKETRDIQKVAVEESRLKIPLLFGLDVIHGFKTTFPIPLAESCSWDPELARKTDAFAAAEAASSGIHWTFAPMVDIARDPRWGRIAEGSGEDPYLGSLFAAARVRGFQGDLSSNKNIAACVKHFAAYGAAEGGRDYNTVDISERTLREIYLKPFKAAVDAGVATIMCSFNEISGVPSSANRFLLTKILRDEWKFRGFVVSDWNSIGELVPHGIASDPKDAAKLAINAGVDMDMQANAYITSLPGLIDEGKVSISTIDESVRRILRLKFQLGLFDNPYKYCDSVREKNTVLSREMLEASLEAAKESAVLLKNENNLLPLKKGLKRIAVIGPLADSRRDPLGPWHQQGQPQLVVTLVEGIKNKLGSNSEVIFEEGCKITDTSRAGFSNAVAAAMKSDVAILCLGESSRMSGEAGSSASLNLPGVQEELAKKIINTGKPVVIVLMNGRPLTIEWLSQNANAILEAWFLGTESGNAIADILFGDYNPGGKLTVTFPRITGQIPVYYNHKNTGRPYKSGDRFTSNYQDIKNGPLYPFGYGLSYTEFKYSNLSVSPGKIKMGDPVHVSVEVKNTGFFEGVEIVQLYLRDITGSVTRPVKELKDFTRVKLMPGETKKVEFEIGPEKLKFYNINMNYSIEPGKFNIYLGTNSEDVLEGSFTVTE